MTYVPQGSNPLLFTPGVDPIMHLDESTFADTVFEPTNTNAFLVEFYADWCGHCRAFAPYYKDLSQKVSSWGDIVRVSAMNCADNFNSQTCRANGVSYFPMLKYFPRTAKTYNDGMLLEASHSGANLRDQLADKVLNEYNRAGYSDWPNFRYLEVTAKTRYEDLWDGVPPAANFLVIIFEQYNSIGAQTILDLYPYRAQIGVRRSLSTSPLVSMLKINMFPYVAMFRRGDQQAIFMSQYGASTVQDVLSRVQPGLMITQLPPVITTTRAPVIDCNAQPERCKSLYFVSETDMLKAVRAALLDEVTRANDFIRGQNFTNLYNFLVLLSEQFPTVSFENTVQRRTRSTSMVLRNSERARMVFSHLKELMDKKPGVISASEWRNQFENIERVYSNPFPVNASWQHCKGSSNQYRGYTCGLWTTFHALTVQSYMESIKNRNQNPLKPLKSIQGWVYSFFGCEDCRNHFMEMTTQLFPMNEQRVRHGHDTVMYLWRAHNLVNNRLNGDVTMDPQFPKYQFPPFFLCPTCHSGGQFSRKQVRNFLMRYYSNIKPYQPSRLRRYW